MPARQSNVSNRLASKTMRHTGDGSGSAGHKVANQKILTHQSVEISPITHHLFPIVIGKMRCPSREISCLSSDTKAEKEINDKFIQTLKYYKRKLKQSLLG